MPLRRIGGGIGSFCVAIGGSADGSAGVSIGGSGGGPRLCDCWHSRVVRISGSCGSGCGGSGCGGGCINRRCSIARG